LHGPARAGGAAARHLHRLADAPNLGRPDRRRPVRAAVAATADRPVVGLPRLRHGAGDRRRVLRHQAGGDGDRRRRRLAHRLARVVGVCLALWIAAIAALASAFGSDGVLAQMAWFFTKAALLTFGGAYAVLPYVYQGAVEQHHWLTAPQMIDGLALGETTPGPLIMVVAFVGFVGGWTRAVFGAESLALAGATAAAVATFFTFLPSFFFIFAGGPFIESTHGRLGFTAPLTGITAAVVGVIVNLAVFFGGHVLWPAGLAGRFDALSAV